VLEDEDAVLDYHTNFDDFGSALLALVRFSLGEDWHEVMYYARARVEAGALVVLFFVFFSVSVSYVMLNLFVSFIVQNYSDTAENYADEARITDDAFSHFVDEWHQLVPATDKSDWIREEDLRALLAKVPPPLGPQKEMRLDNLILALNLPSHEGFLHFNEVLYALARKAVGIPLPDMPQKRELRQMQLSVFPSLKKGRNYHLVADSWAAIKVQQAWRRKRRLRAGVTVETDNEKKLASQAMVMKMMLLHTPDGAEEHNASAGKRFGILEAPSGRKSSILAAPTRTSSHGSRQSPPDGP